jgi:hypothetical protein
MQIAIVTCRVAQLAAFRAGLENRNARIEGFSDAWSLLKAARTRTWNLVIVDGLQVPFHAFLEDLLEINASLNTAVLTDLDPEAFHEAAEGLGILCALPSSPTALDVEPLLERLLAVGGLDPALEAAQARLDEARFKHHPHCVVCWDRHPFGLQVDYRVTGLHAVEGGFGCGKSYEGYEGIIHGGIVSSLLDGAMASCMLAMGHEAYTVDLQIRFRGPVRTALPATIRGEWTRKAGPLHLLNATLEQNGKICASARAKFMEGTPGAPSTPLPISAEVRHLLSLARKRLN